MTHLIVLSKSRWKPAIRREHALCEQAAQHGVLVDFYESPSDVRSAVRRPGQWLRDMAVDRPAETDGVTVHHRSTLVPGHRHPLAATAENTLLSRAVRRRLSAVAAEDALVVVSLPWQWAATASLGVRRVFDAADDWTTLIPHDRPHLRRAYAQIAREADSVIVGNPTLSRLFPGRTAHLVENGMPVGAIGMPTGRPAGRRLIYVGTLSQRFDTALIDTVMASMTDWTLDIYGQCQYPGRGSRPSPELDALLARFGPRVTWHGVVARRQLAGVLDRADVALVPNVVEFSRGQSSMKLGDYAARGLPIVSTVWEDHVEASAPPATWFGTDPASFCAAIEAARQATATDRAANLAWAAEHTWDHQWPRWEAAAFGTTGRSMAGAPAAALREPQ